MAVTLTKDELGRHQARAQGFAQPFTDILTCLRSVVGVYGSAPGAYLSLLPRVKNFQPAAYEDCLEHDKTVVRIQAMRGLLYALLRDLVPAAFVATKPQVENWARRLPMYDLTPENMPMYRDA